jgi:hypothetical protein
MYPTHPFQCFLIVAVLAIAINGTGAVKPNLNGEDMTVASGSSTSAETYNGASTVCILFSEMLTNVCHSVLLMC